MFPGSAPPGNCHKWLCAPKGAGLLHVRPDRQEAIQPTIISHGYNVRRPGRSRFQDAFDWPGTFDPTPCLCVGEAIRFLAGLFDGGIEALMRHNRELALQARRTLCERLDLAPVCAELMIGSMAALQLADDAETDAPLDDTTTPTPTHRLSVELREHNGIEVPVYHWPAPPRTLIRVSAQAYNSPSQYEHLAAVLKRWEGKEGSDGRASRA
jgi:isopenicillin-N epimerase